MADVDNTNHIVHSPEDRKLHKIESQEIRWVKRDYRQIILNLDQMNYLIT